MVYPLVGLSSGWSHQDALSSEWSLIIVVSHEVVSPLGGLSSGWSVIRVTSHWVVCHQGVLSSRWTLLRLVSHQGGLSLGLPLIGMISPQCGLSSGWPLLRTVSHQGGLIGVISHEDGHSSRGLSSEWSLIGMVTDQLCFLRVVPLLWSHWGVFFIWLISHQGGLS